MHVRSLLDSAVFPTGSSALASPGCATQPGDAATLSRRRTCTTARPPPTAKFTLSCRNASAIPAEWGSDRRPQVRLPARQRVSMFRQRRPAPVHFFMESEALKRRWMPATTFGTSSRQQPSASNADPYCAAIGWVSETGSRLAALSRSYRSGDYGSGGVQAFSTSNPRSPTTKPIPPKFWSM